MKGWTLKQEEIIQRELQDKYVQEGFALLCLLRRSTTFGHKVSVYCVALGQMVHNHTSCKHAHLMTTT